MGLDRQTEQLMRELFGGKRCCQCGLPATRLAGERFYCLRHFHRDRRAAGGEERQDQQPRASA